MQHTGHKIRIARAQLATALDLFLEDSDPVSVHCLACGGGEILDAIGSHEQRPTTWQTMERLMPPDKFDAVRRQRNEYWNSFKHYTTHQGAPRNDLPQIEDFDDDLNDHFLFIGWYDYETVTGSAPVHAWLLRPWWFAQYGKVAVNPEGYANARQEFAGINNISRAERKRLLVDRIRQAERDPVVMSKSRVEPSLHIPFPGPLFKPKP